jgi:hypothetical protein
VETYNHVIHAKAFAFGNLKTFKNDYFSVTWNVYHIFVLENVYAVVLILF